MTGLLRRLAEQAVGAPSTLRSVASLPFAPSPEPNRPATARTGPWERPSARTEAPARPASPRVEPSPSTQPQYANPVAQDGPDYVALIPGSDELAHPFSEVPEERPEITAQTRRSPPDRLERGSEKAGGTNHGNARRRVELEPRSPVVRAERSNIDPSLSRAEPSPIPGVPDPTAADWAPDPTAVDWAPDRPPAGRKLPRASNPGSPEVRGRRPEATEPSVAPEPLVQVAYSTIHSPATHEAPGKVQQRPPTGTERAEVEEITEVHVNIGRIEVRTAAASPASKRQKPLAPKQKTMSLDDYLAARGAKR